MRKKKGALITAILAGAIYLTSAGATILPEPETTTIYLVRHAEKVNDGSPDPSLTQEGSRRAAELAHVLSYIPLAAVYSTPFKRTQDTAAPTAEQKGLEIRTYDPKSGREFLDRITNDFTGKSVLIVGHSNTIPVLVNLLINGDRYPQLEDQVYDNLFIVTIGIGGHASVCRLRFGSATPEKQQP